MKSIEELHQIACDKDLDTYVDPVSGFQVLTTKTHLNRGFCCGNSCRHCPFGHINVNQLKNLNSQILKPVLINWTTKESGIDILFWSGGKDSFLALSSLLEEKRNVVLLTSFGSLTNKVSIQNIDIKKIIKQAEYLKIPLCLVPLFPNTDYKKSIKEGLDLIIKKTGCSINRLVFGDLHLTDIRQWRVDTWKEYEVFTPLFNFPYEILLERLWKLKVKYDLEITLSTEIILKDKIIKEGTQYTPTLVKELEQYGIDVMLENGEGHTLVFSLLFK